MELVTYSLLGLLAISICANVHEFGHYIAARFLHVHVHQYIVGLGPCLYKRVDKSGCEIQFCAIPFNTVSELWRMPWSKPDLNRVPPKNTAWPYVAPHARMLIAMAGPAINFLLAALIMLVVQLSTPQHIDTLIDVPEEDSLAFVSGLRSGDRIKAIDNQSTDTWQDIGVALLSWTGRTGTFEIAVDRDGAEVLTQVQVTDWLEDQIRSRPIEDLGIHRARAPTVGGVVDDEIKGEFGIQAGDRIDAVNAIPVKTWAQFSRWVNHSEQEITTLAITRAGTDLFVRIPTAKLVANTDDGDMGLALVAAPPGKADKERRILSRAGEGVVDFFVLTYSSTDQLLKMLVGEYGFANIFGVLQTTQIGTPAAEMNWQSLLMVLALVSIFFGVIMSLPGIIVDGFDIVHGLVEMVAQKPLSKLSYDVLFWVGNFIAFAPLMIVITWDLIRAFT